MALMSTLRGLFGRRDPLDDIPLNPASASEIMDPASGLSSSTFGSDSILSVPSGPGQAGQAGQGFPGAHRASVSSAGAPGGCAQAPASRPSRSGRV